MVHLYNHGLIKIGKALPLHKGDRFQNLVLNCLEIPRNTFSLSTVSGQCHKEQPPSYQESRVHPARWSSHHTALSSERLIKSHKCYRVSRQAGTPGFRQHESVS